MRIYLLVAACSSLVVCTGNAVERCAADDPAIKACMQQSLIDDNVVINGAVVDPGFQKTKEATGLCQVSCATQSVSFEQKWAKFRTPSE